MPTLIPLAYPIPHNETERLAALQDYNILDTLPEQDYDDLTAIAAQIFDMPVSVISLVDRDRQWFKSRHGVDAYETPRDLAFCAHTIMEPDQVLAVPNACEDPRFDQNPLVTGDLSIRFYAGAPLVDANGMALGTICVLDQKPREITLQQMQTLKALSRQVMAQLELRRKTRSLEQEVVQREQSANLAIAKSQALETALNQLQKTQVHLIQAEKMSALGQLVAGIAHEINNPVSFIHGNLGHCKDYADQLLHLIALYQSLFSETPEIAAVRRHIDLDYLVSDFPKLLGSMANGTSRIQDIVRSLRLFSRLDETGIKEVDLHENLEAILMMMESRLQATAQRPAIQLLRHYGQLPLVACNIKDLNQVFVQLLNNAIDALELGVGRQSFSIQPTIVVTTEVVTTGTGDHVRISVMDNGEGMAAPIQERIFEPFYTTKPVGQGTGMGLAMSYQIVVEQHGGQLDCASNPGRGAEFTIEIPVNHTSM
jgi:two-component system, NtrC family, sensor kinase